MVAVAAGILVGIGAFKPTTAQAFGWGYRSCCGGFYGYRWAYPRFYGYRHYPRYYGSSFYYPRYRYFRPRFYGGYFGPRFYGFRPFYGARVGYWRGWRGRGFGFRRGRW